MSDTPTQNPYLIQTNPVENRTVQFFKDSVQVGCFDFGVSPVTFTGDVDESARIFVDYVISKVQTELTATREELKAVTEQRDRLAEALEQWRLSSVCRELVGQRDRLAEALERIFDYQGRFAEDDPQSIAAEALQAINQNDRADTRHE